MTFRSRSHLTPGVTRRPRARYMRLLLPLGLRVHGFVRRLVEAHTTVPPLSSLLFVDVCFVRRGALSSSHNRQQRGRHLGERVV
jgi:hypothetical protein